MLRLTSEILFLFLRVMRLNNFLIEFFSAYRVSATVLLALLPLGKFFSKIVSHCIVLASHRIVSSGFQTSLIHFDRLVFSKFSSFFIL